MRVYVYVEHVCLKCVSEHVCLCVFECMCMYERERECVLLVTTCAWVPMEYRRVHQNLLDLL